MYRALPIFIPEPIAFGQYKVQSPMCHFYIQQFVEMDVTSAPDPAEFTSKLADFHRNSVNPTGKFGYQVSTCDGRVKNEVAWKNTWPELYTQLIEGKFKLDIAANGPWPEYERAFKQIIDKVIPHLLVGLKSEGEPIKPCLIHGDLWDGNMGIRMDTGESITFDASSYYAHNEMEFGQWKLEIATHLRSDIYTRHYLQNYPAAEPVEEFDDRVRLYSLRGGINYSSGHPQSTLRIS
jgi:fructosamine-3-kinase